MADTEAKSIIGTNVVEVLVEDPRAEFNGCTHRYWKILEIFRSREGLQARLQNEHGGKDRTLPVTQLSEESFVLESGVRELLEVYLNNT